MSAYTNIQKSYHYVLNKFYIMMKNYEQSVQINRNPSWTCIPDHLYRILTIGS